MEKSPRPHYDHVAAESKWQAVWKQSGIDKTPTDPKHPYYNLVMIPYPSGDLHIGHWYATSLPDTLARFERMRGQDVLAPFGFDSFGLPAENAAIQRGLKADKWTDEQVVKMKHQVEQIGAMFDWDLTIDTSKPDYYKWTQWLFTKLFKAGKAIQRDGLVNWCPKDKTVLANEQVIHGTCDRCGTTVERKNLKQWYFTITDYTEDLLQDLDDLDWPEKIKVQQRNWIGKSRGAKIRFTVYGDPNTEEVEDAIAQSRRSNRRVTLVEDTVDPLANIPTHHPNLQLTGLGTHVEVYTTRPDTLFGVTFMVLAPEHPMVEELTTPQHKLTVTKYVEWAGARTNVERMESKDKTGVFTGGYVINPANGAKLPVWVADYVLMEYGTGAIMAVPAHDDRDHAFAKKYNLPIIPVIDPVTGQAQNNPVEKDKIVALLERADGKILTLQWGPDLGGRLLVGGTVEDGEDPVAAATREIIEETGYKDFELVEHAPERVHHEYFAFSKNQAVLAHTDIFHFKLIDEEPATQTLEDNEHDKFELQWITKDQARAEIEDEQHLYLVEKFGFGQCWTGTGILINSGQFDGLTQAEGIRQITDWLLERGDGEQTTNYRLRDWLISRQRYWGTPIPIIHCETCGAVPVPESDLPVLLPLDQTFDRTGRSPLQTHPDFVKATCPECNSPNARRETDTMDTFVDSSWYFLRFPNPHYTAGPWDPAALKTWLPVNRYMGGAEHAILHLLYSRFITKFLHSEGLLDFDEPFTQLLNQGMILGPDGNKMSKSKGNVLNPDEYVAKYGADTVRIYLMFIGPWEDGGPWDPQRFEGAYRFIQKTYAAVTTGYQAQDLDAARETAMEIRLHKLIKKATEDLAQAHFNTTVAALMEYINALTVDRSAGVISEDFWQSAALTFVRVIAPLMPHLAEELWQELGQTESVHLEPWPVFEAAKTQDALVTIAVQVNGKLRGEFVTESGRVPGAIEATARAENSRQDWTKGAEIIKVIVIPDRLVNFVVTS